MPINRHAAFIIKEFNKNSEEHIQAYALEQGIKIINEDEYCRCHIWKKIENTLDLWQCKNCEKLAVSDKEPMNRNQVYITCHQRILDNLRGGMFSNFEIDNLIEQYEKENPCLNL